ncbi:transferase [Paenibacillus baekrokdamisoli]|uniref:Transferase n=1 Tax=Paenibacillus baekrokdamisoli TaxID=1712516 RepID=A0A3G9IUV6_9BACL|nr:carbamoyltransferase C-terminal domain-containing protein [Paenibacillus baekrokdamisoli]MBB3068375.1 carbamoyltransferase [Paenibacillus baekrokdamisoli]BBH22580.1 transferase [Paenibacillus baekrokdamisoli]
MKIIGINSQFDSSMMTVNSGSCALIIDGKIKNALAEDRISRIKDEGGFKASLQAILIENNLTVEDIDYFCISFYGNAMIPREKMIKLHLKEIGIESTPEKLVVLGSHHLSHACAAYYLSPFDEAIIVVADNEGSLLFGKNDESKNIMYNYCERNSYFWAKGNEIVLIGRDFAAPGSVAFGKAYNKFNEYVGYGSYLNVGKTMGLSSYGTLPKEYEQLDLWGMNEDGSLYSNIKETYDSFNDIWNFFEMNNVSIVEGNNKDFQESSDYKNLAYFIQSQLNKWSVKKIDYLQKLTGIKNVCISGGIALNGIMNREIETNLNCDVFVPPYPSDPGQALGNAIYCSILKSDMSNNVLMPKKTYDEFMYLGLNYNKDASMKIIEKFNSDVSIVDCKEGNVFELTAKLISEGNIIGFYNGKSEYGARALGNRSIVADPRFDEIRDRVNTLKGRELFRPIAPSVLSEFAHLFFNDIDKYMDKYMLKVSYCKEEKRELIKAVVHIDGTSRIQLVTKESNLNYYSLIREFMNITNIPMLINTSFNAAGEPIVETPEDAIKSFIHMNLDYLYCNGILIRRK